EFLRAADGHRKLFDELYQAAAGGDKKAQAKAARKLRQTDRAQERARAKVEAARASLERVHEESFGLVAVALRPENPPGPLPIAKHPALAPDLAAAADRAARFVGGVTAAPAGGPLPTVIVAPVDPDAANPAAGRAHFAGPRHTGGTVSVIRLGAHD